jgi:hypothetical protein
MVQRKKISMLPLTALSALVLMLLCPTDMLMGVERNIIEVAESSMIVEYTDWHITTQPIEIHGTTYYRISEINSVPLGKIGAPDVPQFIETVLLPAGKTIAVTVLDIDDVSSPGIFVSPFPHVNPSTHEHETLTPERAYVFDDAVYAVQFPARPVITGSEHIFRKQRFQTFAIMPVQYDGRTRLLHMHQRIRIRIDFVDDN